MKIKILTLLILSLLCCNAKAQLQPIFTVPSPEVAGLGEYGKVPVNLYTGIPDISIPLYEIRIGNFSLPLSANYHVASVKANTQSGPLGVGWSLFAGGYITRSVRGIPDETIGSANTGGSNPRTTYHGFYYNAGKMKNITAENVTVHDKYATGDDFYELSADEFSFSFCGYSGDFYMNEDGGWSVVSDQKIEVQFDEQDGGFIGVPELAGRIDISNWERRRETMRFFNKFTLLTPDGCQYEFGGPAATEFCTPYYNRNKGDLIATTWRLSKITTADKKIIEFTYDTSAIICDVKHVPTSTETEIQGFYEYISTTRRGSYTGFLIFPINIKQIKTPNEIIYFGYQNDDFYLLSMDFDTINPKYYLGWKSSFEPESRYDFFGRYTNDMPARQFHVFLPGMKPVQGGDSYYKDDRAVHNAARERFKKSNLKSILVVRNLSSPNYQTDPILDKAITFVYPDFSYNERRKVIAIEERCPRLLSTTANGLLSASFGYDNVDFTIFDPTPKIHRFTYHEQKLPFYYLTAGADLWGYYNGGVTTEREKPSGQNEMFAKADVLTEIKYPTGGKSKFEFEKNRYSKIVDTTRVSLISKSGMAGCLRIKSVTKMDQNDHILETKKYFYTEEYGGQSSTASSGILRELPVKMVLYSDNYGNRIEHNSANGFFASITGQNTPDVGYSCVIEETLDGEGISQGYIRYRFSNYDTDIYGQQHMDEEALYSDIKNTSYIKPYTSLSAERGKLLSEEHFDKTGTLKKEITHHYTKTDASYLKTVHQLYIKNPLNSAGNDHYETTLTRTYLYSYLLDKTTETLWEGPTGQEVTKSQTFTYNVNKLPSKVVSNTSEGGSQTVEYKYLGDDAAHQWLFQFEGVDHVLTPLVEKKTTKGGSTLLERYTYGATNGIPYLKKGETTIGNTYPRTEFTINRVDSWGNPVEVDEKNLTTVMLWGYKGQRLIAKIVNASLNELSLVPSSYNTGETQNIYSQIEGMRKNFPTSQFYIYKYDGRLQLQSVSNPNGVSTLFNYDPWGRLTESYYIEGTGSSARKRLLNSYDYFYGADVVQQ